MKRSIYVSYDNNIYLIQSVDEEISVVFDCNSLLQQALNISSARVIQGSPVN